MAVLDAAELDALWRQAGGSLDTVLIAVAIALCESSGVSDAYSSAGAIGLWQILPSAHPEYDPALLYDPLYNAQAAVAVSNQGTNWHPWCSAWTDNQCGQLGGIYAPYGGTDSQGRESCGAKQLRELPQVLPGVPPIPPAVSTVTGIAHAQQRLIKAAEQREAAAAIAEAHLPKAWAIVTYALSRTVPTRSHDMRLLGRAMIRRVR